MQGHANVRTPTLALTVPGGTATVRALPAGAIRERVR